MLRSRATLTAPIVLAIVLIGVFAMQSRGTEVPELTQQRQNCAPVARADVVVTAPGVPVDVDVLANDTDADGDPLVFQILQANGGVAEVVDGGTPLDGSDDRVRFLPSDPAAPQASFGYQAVDPDGAFDASLVTVFVNAQRLPPPGVQSESKDVDTGACGTSSVTQTTLASDSTSSTVEGADDSGASTATSGNRRVRTTTSLPRGGATTTTRPNSSATPPPFPTTTRPPTPPTNPPSSDPDCGPPPTSGSEAEEEAYKKCLRNSR